MGMCYEPNCGNMGVNQCNIYLCCKNLGCQRVMCQEHTAKKKCWCGANQHGMNARVCLDCEKPVLKKLRVYCWLMIFFIFLMLALNLGLRWYFGEFGGRDEDEHEELHDGDHH